MLIFFYSHRLDSNTPLEETMMALDHIVRQGKALYVGISNYNTEQTKKVIKILKKLGTPMIIHQASYSMFDRWVEEDGLLEVLAKEGAGCIAFSPLAQGLLTDRYLHGITKDSRIAKSHIPFLNKKDIDDQKLKVIHQLNEVANERGQSLAQMSLAWVLRKEEITSVIIGTSKVSQIKENVAAIKNLELTDEELNTIESILR